MFWQETSHEWTRSCTINSLKEDGNEFIPDWILELVGLPSQQYVLQIYMLLCESRSYLSVARASACVSKAELPASGMSDSVKGRQNLEIGVT